MDIPAGPPLVFVDDVGSLQISDVDRHHLERVLRLRSGDPLTAGDGRGRWRSCRFGPSIAPDGEIQSAAPPLPPITVAVALTKGDRPEWAVQKLTEAGVDRVILFRAQRSVVRWDEGKVIRNLERLRTVAREAAMQSRRAWLPVIDGVRTFQDAAALPGACLAQRDGASGPSLDRPVVLVGPEGGWSEEEEGCGLPLVSLGPSVLRAETAAIASGILLVAARSGVMAARDR